MSDAPGTSRPILVINCGSSSLKFALVDPATGEQLQHGLLERVTNHAEALDTVLQQLGQQAVAAVGHRVVHGGEHFTESALLSDAALTELRACTPLAPLHNPANLLGIEAARERFPDTAHVAVFDTAFHQSLPPKAFMYALPYELYEQHKVRRYGFHGTSHAYVAGAAAELLGKPLAELQLVTAHLGNGCSCTAVKGGQSVDTSMGLTPLEGLVMGTRSGDVDPGLHGFLADNLGLDLSQITELLNRKSGLLGLSGRSNDMRTLLAAAGQGEPRAKLAIDVFCHRLAKAILGLCASLERVDAVIFTGGIGEHAAPIRAATLELLKVLGPELDPAANAAHGKTSGGRITADGSRLVALVVPTNEELVIAREAARIAGSARAESSSSAR